MNEEIDVETIVLEDNVEYMIIDKETIDNTTYLYLSNINDKDDFCIRKIETVNGEEVIATLDSDDEFDKCILKFTEKFN